MIQWLREKFEAWIKILVILTIVIDGIAGGILFASMSRGGFGRGVFSFFIGVIIFCLLSLIFCIVFYGFVATVICLAKSTEAIKDKLHVLDEISSKLNSVGAAEKSSASSSESKTETFDTVRINSDGTVCINGKKLAVKDNAPGKYFCPKCYAPVVTTDFSCNNCNASLVAD